MKDLIHYKDLYVGVCQHIETIDEYVISIINDLDEILIQTGAYGIAAPQIGENINLCLIRSSPRNIVMINPKIIHFEGSQKIDEGCLTFPGLIFNVCRANEIRVRYMNVLGNIVTEKYTGISAQTIQHEIDHLNGRTFLFGLSKLKVDMQIKKAHNMGLEYRYSDLFNFVNQ